LKNLLQKDFAGGRTFLRKTKAQPFPAVLNFLYEQLSGSKAVRLAAARTGPLPALRERLRCTRNTRTLKPPILPSGTATAFS
jgi:hypothetical protein